MGIKINLIIEDFCVYLQKDWRLEQMLDKTFDLINGGKIDIKQMGMFIKNVMGDILKEESDILAEAGLEPKDISGKVAERSKNYFFAKQNEAVGLN
jgi:hypothetical protein